METWCIQRAAIVVTVGKGIARFQEEAFGCQPIIIRNCHDARLDREPVQSLRKSLGLNAEDFLLVTIGQAKKGQAIQEALDALLGLPEFVHLAFIGGNYKAHIEKHLTNRLEKRVHFVSPVRPDEVVPFVKSADASLILYYPRSVNYEYCLPNSLFQAIDAELPLLYPELPEISEIAKKYDLGITINPKIPRSISLAVKALLNDPAEIVRFKNNLREVKTALSWEQEEKVLKKLILNVFDNNGQIK
jgi:glycosyltransferase involved in cell wall biosynthesis